MSQTSICVLPTAILTPGNYGPYVAPQMNGVFSGWIIDVAPGPAWPATGGQVLEMTLERSTDGGNTWQFDASSDFGPLSGWRDPTHAFFATGYGTVAGVPQYCSATDIYRFTLNVFRTCSPTFTFSGVN